jgi:hypothetical protein
MKSKAPFVNYTTTLNFLVDWLAGCDMNFLIPRLSPNEPAMTNYAQEEVFG